MKKPNCANMTVAPCDLPIKMIDEKGFVYCLKCGPLRKRTGTRCRKLRPSELFKINGGVPLEAYDAKAKGEV